MTYTIKQVSEMMSLPISTIRYYDKMGLILDSSLQNAVESIRNDVFTCFYYSLL